MMTDDICGIYLITNKNTGQMYVGQSINIQRRFGAHRRTEDLGHSRIDNAINKYGAENFSFEIIITLENDTEKLNNAEREWIAILNTYEDKNHYNLTPGGDFNPSKLPEVQAKMSKALSGENHPMYGKKHLEDTRKKISKAMSGENNPMFGKKGEESPFFGHKHTPETKAKMSKAKYAQNTTGYFRVSKKKDSTCKQGFYYRYQYRENGKLHSISSVSLEKLEKKVKDKGLKWLKLEE